VQEAGENYSDTEHTVPELLNRFIADAAGLNTAPRATAGLCPLIRS
jgi:hypothetical protein